MDLTELKLKVPAGLPLFPEALQKNPYPCLFQLPQGAHIPRWQPLPPPSKLAMGSGFPHIPSIQPLLYFKAIFKDQHYTGPTRQAQANLPILRSADEHFLSKYWNISTGSRNQDVNISEWKLFSLPHGISLYFKTSLGGRQKDFCFYRQEADCGAKQLGQGHRLALRSTCLQVPSRTLHCVFNGTIFRFRMYTVFCSILYSEHCLNNKKPILFFYLHFEKGFYHQRDQRHGEEQSSFLDTPPGPVYTHLHTPSHQAAVSIQ